MIGGGGRPNCCEHFKNNPLISSRVCLSLRYASSGGIFISMISLSILLITTTTPNLYLIICFINFSVINITPSIASTTRRTPSQALIPATVSPRKFGWPGASMKLIT